MKHFVRFVLKSAVKIKYYFYYIRQILTSYYIRDSFHLRRIIPILVELKLIPNLSLFVLIKTSWSLCQLMWMFSPQRLPNGPASILDDADIDRQREGEIERQRSELGQLKERLALMCRQVPKQKQSRSTQLGLIGSNLQGYLAV